ncbi:ankyrin repeat domain-containing protein [Candidatus Dependentiae bacterium]|nr:ankyrin repeat domain-containing protein [Candidatus Dependentiae bacterium]
MSSKIYLLILLNLPLNCFSMELKEEVELHVTLKKDLEALNINLEQTIEQNLENHLQNQILSIFSKMDYGNFFKQKIREQIGKLIRKAYSQEQINEALFQYAYKEEIQIGTITTTYKVQLLLDAGANINAKNTTGYTPISIAAYRGNLNLIQLLIENGANVDQSVLNNAILSKENSLQIVKMILDQEIDLNYKTNFEPGVHPVRMVLSPAEHAEYIGKHDIAKLIKEKMTEQGLLK